MPDFRIVVSRTSVLLLLVAGLSFQSSQLQAKGAIALGLPHDVAKLGLAYGYAANAATSEEAKALALQKCQTNVSASKVIQNLCRVIETFDGKCVAFALDPKVGTPGWGWSVGIDLEAAKTQAISQCKAIAGIGREEFCQIESSVCDK